MVSYMIFWLMMGYLVAWVMMGYLIAWVMICKQNSHLKSLKRIELSGLTDLL